MFNVVSHHSDRFNDPTISHRDYIYYSLEEAVVLAGRPGELARSGRRSSSLLRVSHRLTVACETHTKAPAI